MPTSSHTRIFVTGFNKLAAQMDISMSSVTRKTPTKPASMGDMGKQTRQKATRPQTYSQPVGKTDITNPNTSIQQKAVPPPPVM